MILIEKEKIRYYEFYDQDGLDKYVDVTDKGGLIKSLTEEVVFVSDLTFRDFFNHLLREKHDLNKTFFSTMRGCKIDDFEQDINTFKKQQNDTEITNVQVDWRIKVNKGELEIISSFHGVDSKGGNRENAVETAYGMSLTPLHEYADLPFRLNRNFIIEDYSGNTVKKILKSIKAFTVFEVIHAVLYEITWDGIPQERDIRAKELYESLEKSEEDIAKGNYKTWDEVKEDMESRFPKK